MPRLTPFLPALLSLIALPVWAEPPRVVADIAPVHSLVAQVMDGVATPDLLLSQGNDPHNVQLRPSQARMLANAELIVWVGPTLSPWLGRAIAGLGAADQIVLLEHPSTQLRALSDAEHDDHDDADHAAEDNDAPNHGAEDHDHGAVDPHAWLSPDNAQAWVAALAEDLAARDPENAAAYRANAAAATARLSALSADIAATLAPYAGADVITFHDAFGYFADRFGLQIAGSVRPSDAAAPSAAALSALRAVVAEHDVRCAFTEPGYDPALLTAIAADSGLRVAELDATGAGQVPGPDHYAATLTALADSIAGCLSAD